VFRNGVHEKRTSLISILVNGTRTHAVKMISTSVIFKRQSSGYPKEMPGNRWMIEYDGIVFGYRQLSTV
jgi:ribosomal protein L35AE/L33A